MARNRGRERGGTGWGVSKWGHRVERGGYRIENSEAMERRLKKRGKKSMGMSTEREGDGAKESKEERGV